jgi:hypothetical protein
MESVTFEDIAIVSCGTMSLELNFLREDGFLNAREIIYTVPGLHQDVLELERQLVSRIVKAGGKHDKVIVVYGGKFCYVNVEEPTRLMETIVNEQGGSIGRVRATHCMDMLVGEEDRKKIAAEVAGGEPVWWMTPGWVKYRTQVFKGWDKAVANENFPRHTGGAIVLDGTGYMDTFMAEKPEEFLEYADWMGISLIPYAITLDRFKKLLTDEVVKLAG